MVVIMLGVWLGMAQQGEEGAGSRTTNLPRLPAPAQCARTVRVQQSGLGVIAGPNHGIWRRALLLRLQEMGI